jgi:hypothetical protein
MQAEAELQPAWSIFIKIFYNLNVLKFVIELSVLLLCIALYLGLPTNGDLIPEACRSI